MKNQLKDAKKESQSNDALNASNIKIDLSKGKKSLLDKEDAKGSSKSIYKGLDALGSEDKKKKRSKIRRGLRGYINDILGKDRSDEERLISIESFMEFYKENWKIQDFKIENFSSSRNEIDLKDCKNLLDYLKSIIG